MKKKASKTKAAAKTKTKTKAKARTVKAKAKARPAKATKAKTKTKPAGDGLTVIDLFKMKKEREQAAQNPGAWKHRKDLPPQDQHAPEDAKSTNNVKKGGFGGARHH
jgi:hypothetical protein